MPNFLVASLYVDRDVDLADSKLSALTPFDALVKDCMGNCKVEEWEACQLLETESWNAIVWLLTSDGPVRVDYAEMNFPWRRVNTINERIGKLNEAMSLVGKLEILEEVPGMNSEALDLTPVREMLVELKIQRHNISDAWEKRKAKPPDNARQLRSVQIDSPEGDDNDVVPF